MLLPSDYNWGPSPPSNQVELTPSYLGPLRWLYFCPMESIDSETEYEIQGKCLEPEPAPVWIGIQGGRIQKHYFDGTCYRIPIPDRSQLITLHAIVDYTQYLIKFNGYSLQKDTSEIRMLTKCNERFSCEASTSDEGGVGFLAAWNNCCRTHQVTGTTPDVDESPKTFSWTCGDAKSKGEAILEMVEYFDASWGNNFGICTGSEFCPETEECLPTGVYSNQPFWGIGGDDIDLEIDNEECEYTATWSVEDGSVVLTPANCECM